jgi:DNA gyrase/topoisomerase IV subunit B
MRRGRAKLEDCERHGPDSGSELLVVEGDSAALAVCQGRDPRVQAVLPMQGKPMNALKATDGKVATNPFLRALAEAIGARLRASGATALTALRYRGLAGLDPSVLVESCVRRETRNRRILGPADAQAAMNVFASLRELPPQGTLF